MAAEEKAGFVIRLQDVPVIVFEHGGQLLQVADHEQLYTAKGFVTALVFAQDLINSIQNVSAYHADFIDDQQIKASQNIDFLTAETIDSGCHISIARNRDGSYLFRILRYLRPKRHLEERVNGDTSRIDGSHAGRSNDYHPFG